MIKLYITKLLTGEKPHDAAVRALDFALDNNYNLEFKDLIIEKTVYGKPYFPQHDAIKFNLSHSGEYAAAAISDTEVGLDIELIKYVNPKIINRYLLGIVMGDTEADIIEAWCRRESYGKYTGEGFMRADFSREHYIEILQCISGYITAVCSAYRSDIIITEI
jgi:Phosphopantetheinyl transferase